MQYDLERNSQIYKFITVSPNVELFIDPYSWIQHTNLSVMQSLWCFIQNQSLCVIKKAKLVFALSLGCQQRDIGSLCIFWNQLGCLSVHLKVRLQYLEPFLLVDEISAIDCWLEKALNCSFPPQVLEYNCIFFNATLVSSNTCLQSASQIEIASHSENLNILAGIEHPCSFLVSGILQGPLDFTFHNVRLKFVKS